MEDAVLRVLRGVLAEPTELVEFKPRKTQKKGNDIAAVQAKIDRLVNLHLEGRIDEADFNRVYTELVAEKEKAQQIPINDPVTEQRAQAMTLMAKGELTREELRQLLLLVIERVEAPIVVEGVTIRSDRKTLRRLARVRTRFPNPEGVEEYLSAIYMDKYGGTRTFIPVKEGEEPHLKRLIGDRPRSQNDEEQSNLPLDDSG